MNLKNIIEIIQIVVAVLVMILILLQERGSGLGEAFGDAASGGNFQRRGPEKAIFFATIAGVVIFIASSIATLLIF